MKPHQRTDKLLTIGEINTPMAHDPIKNVPEQLKPNQFVNRGSNRNLEENEKVR